MAATQGVRSPREGQLSVMAVAPVVWMAVAIWSQADTTTFRDSATAAVIARARERHLAADSELLDYRARIETRLEMVASRSRFSKAMPLVVHQTAAQVTWRAPNDLAVLVLGARSALPVLRVLEAWGGGTQRLETDEDFRRELEQEVWLDRPWFVPRALGDSIRLMGVPDLAALHPLARGAARYYRYAIADSVVLEMAGRRVRAVAVQVEPKQRGPSLVAGDMWVDADRGDVVRLRVLFLGEYVWERPARATARDSAKARAESARTARYVSAEADLEYAWYEGGFWMPYRQGVAVTLQVPWLLGLAASIRAVTWFRDYGLNTGAPVAFGVPDSVLRERTRGRSALVCSGCAHGDSGGAPERAVAGYRRGGLWAGGRWEVAVPPADSLSRYAWPEPLVADIEPSVERWLQQSAAELEKLKDQLPGAWVGRRRLGLAWERLGDAFRFNRVQGPTVGAGLALRAAQPFVALLGSLGFGFADHWLWGRFAWRYDGPEGLVELVGFREVQAVEPWSKPALGGSLNALISGHDDADYYLATGGGVEVSPNRGLLRHSRIRLSVQREQSVLTRAGSALNRALGGDGHFPPNPAIAAGDYLRLSASRSHGLGPLQWWSAGELWYRGDAIAGRIWTHGRLAVRVAGRAVIFRGTLQAAAGDSLPQAWPRVGGTATVRGYDYGTRWSRAAWAGQLDVHLRRRGVLVPVVFLDVGDGVPSRDPLIGAGVGLAVLGGILRLDLSRGLNPLEPVRFDLGTALGR